jgi:hypothetical protein
MTITYPLDLPSSAARYVQATIGMDSAVGMAESPFTYQGQTQVHPGQRWRLRLVLAPMRGRAFSDWLGWFGSLNGREGTFLAFDSALCRPFGAATGTPLVDGGGNAAGSRVLTTKGWTPGVTGILRRGDRFQLGSGSTARLHMVTKAAASDGAGKASLDIWPSLRAAPADNAPLVTLNPKTQFQLVSNAQDFERAGGRYAVTLDAMEALR